MKTQKEAIKIIEILKETYPNAKCSLDFTTPFEMMVSVMLSAQCTDARVNLTTPELFKDYNTPEKMANIDIKVLEKIIHPCGFYKNKSKNIIAASKMLIEKYSGKVPDDIDELVKIPGVGRKSANVIMLEAFKNPCGIAIVSQKNGTKKKVRKPVISSLLFFQSTEKQALELQTQLNGRVMLYTERENYSKKPIAISDKEMNTFILVSSSGEKGLEYFGEDKMKFRKGEHVRVIDGAFKGAEGYICRIKGDHRLIVSIQGVCAVATSYIPQCFLQKI